MWNGPAYAYHLAYTFVLVLCKRVNLEVLCLERQGLKVGPHPPTTPWNTLAGTCNKGASSSYHSLEHPHGHMQQGLMLLRKWNGPTYA
jgi:hypothetical protein